MNILQVISKLDGSEAARDTMASTRFLTLNGHKICVASEKSASVKEIDEVGARHYVVPIGGNILLAPRAVYKLSQLILKEGIQVVHTRDAFSSFVAFFASRLRGCTFVATIYPSEKRNFFWRTQFWAKRVMCFTESEARHLVKNNLITQRKIRVVPPFIWDTRAQGVVIPNEPRRPQAGRASEGSYRRTNFTIGMALPLASPEAVQNFIKTVSLLARSINRLKVLAINNGLAYKKEAIEKLKLLIKRYSLASVITFFPGTQEKDFLSGLNLFTQISISNAPSPRLLLEAEARGIPVITTYADWVSGYVKDNKKAVCQTDAPRELSAAVYALYKNEKLRFRMADEAQKFAKEKFSIKNIIISTLVLYEEALSENNILVIKIGALGDAILATPSLMAIRKKFPKAKIKLLVGINNRDVFANSSFIDELMVCDFKERDKGLFGLLRIAREMRSEDFDMTVDLQNNKKSHILAFLSCAPKRYGYSNGKLSCLLNRKAKEPGLPIGPVEHQARVLGLLGIYRIDPKLRLWPSKEDEKWAEDFLKSHWTQDSTKLMAVNIGASPRWITKQWPGEYFADICNKLARNFGIRIVLIGLESENPRLEKFRSRAKCKPIDAMGKTNIPRLASLIKRCDLLLSSDSAPLHVATAAGTPFVAFFGPTDPKRHLAFLPKGSVVFKKDLKCSPCYSTHCAKGHKCMRLIKPDEVYEAVVKLLGVKK